MQEVNLEDVHNPKNWCVKQDDSGLYFLQSDKGTRLNRRYTSRNFAEKALQDYLIKMAQPPRPVGRPPKNGNT